MGSCLRCVVFLFLVSVCESCVREERRALLLIKESLNNPNGSSLPDWVGDDCCSWNGVICDDQSSSPRVIQILVADTRKVGQGGWYPNATLFAQFKALEEIDLSGTQFRGWVMPQGLDHLKGLKSLTMKSNQLNDASWIKNLTSLTYIDLSNNELTRASFLSGLEELTELHLSSNKLIDSDVALWINNLTSLTDIYLSDNSLSEALWVYNSTNLQRIDVSKNRLYDSSIITGICEMQSLEYLDLGQNKILGNIPPCLDNLSSLNHIDLSMNNLLGVMPFSVLANLSYLNVVDLSRNYNLQVETELPSWHPSFQLYWLYLGNCILNKHSGGGIPSFLSSQQLLTRLDLVHSSLMGEIPAFLIYNNSLDALRLKENGLVRSFPVPQNVTSNLRFLDISRNSISETLFRDVGIYFPNLKHLNLSTNNLEGSIPPSLGKIASLWVLDLSCNNFSGGIPAMLTRNTKLKFLILSNNTLSGKMLPNSSNMPGLEMLDLHGNLFTGMMPRDLLNSPLLKLLDVRRNSLLGAIPSWLHNLRELVALFLRSNAFEGPIPAELCQLQNLHILDLSHNHLSGTIPQCLSGITSLQKVSPVQLTIPGEGNKTFERSSISFVFTTKGLSYTYKGTPFSLMTGIDLSTNRLSGNLPGEIGDLAALVSLNLSNNLITGPLPASLQKLTHLESLDLSHNELDGVIPPGIVKLTSLSVFRVAHNNLSGCIPDSNQFTTFEASSYEGNPGLHGRLLGSSCSDGDRPPQSHNKGEAPAEEEVKIMDRKWVYYLLIGSSYAIGVWVVVVTLVFMQQWRKAYFDAVDSYLDACVWRIMTYFRSEN